MKKRKTLQPKAEGQPLEYDEGARRVGGAPEAAVPVDSRIACEKRARELLEHMREDGEYDRYFEIDGEDAKLFHTWIKERLGATGTLPSKERPLLDVIRDIRDMLGVIAPADFVDPAGDKMRAAESAWCLADNVLFAATVAPPPETYDGLPVSQEPKYTVTNGRLVNRASGKPIPDDEPVFILRAKDRVAVYAIMAYRAQCTGNPEHHDAVDARVGDFLRFKEAHPQRIKSPDTTALKASEGPG